MMKVKCMWIAGWAALIPLTSGAADEALRLANEKGELLVDSQGISLVSKIDACPAITAKGEPLWAVLIQPDMPPPIQGDVVVLTDKTQILKRTAEAGGIRLSCESLTDGNRTWKIGLTLGIRPKGDSFEVTGEISNREKGWMVCGFTGPVLHGIQADLATQPVLMADGFGRRVNRAPGVDGKPAPWQRMGDRFEVTTQYPSRRGTMQWSAFAGAKGGFYLGSHDPAHGAKTFSVRHNPGDGSFGLAIKHQMFCPAGQRWALPPTVFLPYEGTWHAAARHYRAWVDKTLAVNRAPAWVRDSSGWLLCILKQQNGEVMWDYPSLGALCDVADARGLDILGLFGWAHGGHDHLYPDYHPDPEMGGEEALRQALKEVRRRGKRTILYANGQLMERETGFWSSLGKDLAIVQRDGIPVQQTWHKFRNAPAYQFDLGCLAAAGWYDRMLSLALQANDLGADGILYDQLGVSAPMACYAAGHGHPVPSMVYTADRTAFLRRIGEHMKQVNPDFIVMTEGLHDSVADSVSLFHGCMLGMFTADCSETPERLRGEKVSNAFPEMFRYTYPEVMSTVRVPTPMMDRAMANYTCAYGLRYEIESRYAPDVRYLKEGRLPEAAEYEQVLSKPDLGMMNATLPAEATRYLKQAIEFGRANAALLWNGRFTDGEGFAFQGDGLVAKGFAAQDRFGVLVWNPGEKPAPFTLDVPGAALLSASEPEAGAVEAFSSMPPQTVRLLVWRRNGN